jgi:hypothetical protein
VRPIEDLLPERDEDTIHALARYVQDYVDERWQPVLREGREELLRLYEKAGEPAYGTYANKLFRPVREELGRAGFLSEPAFPGALSASREWGPGEDRERWMWSVVQRGQGPPLGAIVVGLFHDHTRFRVPRAPGVLALEETDADAIIRTLSRVLGHQGSDR